MYKGNSIPGLCTLFLSPSFSFLLWAVICCGGKKAYLTRQLAILLFFVLFFILSKVRAVISFGTFKQLSPLLCHFQPVAIGWECLFSLIFSFLFFSLSIFLFKWHFLGCSLWVVSMFSLSWTEKKVIKKKIKLSSLTGFFVIMSENTSMCCEQNRKRLTVANIIHKDPRWLIRYFLAFCTVLHCVS